jgi:hypothetical protein
MDAQCQRTSVRKNSQDVGLEAAIIERVRNSSLVECAGTDNEARLKHPTEAVNPCSPSANRMVGERSQRGEARPQGLVERGEVRMPE